jgi:hypothetical protein
MARISLIPQDSTVVYDGLVAFGVNFTGIDPSIHAIQWYDNQGQVEYERDPMTGEGPLNEDITSIAPFQSYITQAQEIIYAFQNPVFVYSTVDGLFYGDGSYDLGDEIVIDTPDTTPPPQSTPLVPPTLEDYQELYWSGTAWVASAFDITLSLPQAKANLIAQVQTSGAVAVNDQARTYSVVQLDQAADITTLLTADYLGLSLGAYQTYIDGEISAQETIINAATATSDLYSFNPTVNPVP